MDSGVVLESGLTEHVVDPPLRTRQSARLGLLIRRIRADIQLPLFRNAYALVLNNGLQAVLGIGYWTLAARLYTANELGRTSALVAAMSLVSILAQFSLTPALVRFLPTAGASTKRFIATVYGIGAVGSLVLGSAVVLGAHRWAPSDSPLRMTGATGVLFVASVLVWSVFALQDGVITGLRRATWVPLENAVFGVAKIFLLVGFAAASFKLGIFVSWVVPAALLILPMNVMIFRCLVPSKAPERENSRFGSRQVARFVAGDYFGVLFAQASTTGLPLVVIATLGAAGNARFYVAWAVLTSVDLIAHNLTMSLVAEAASDEGRLSEYVRGIIRRGLCIFVPLVFGVVAAAPLLLSLFGSEYAGAATPLLRILAIGVLARAATTVFLGVARVQRRIARIVCTQAVQCIMLLGLTVVLVRPLGLVGVGVAYAVTQVLVAASVLPSLLRAMRVAPDQAADLRRPALVSERAREWDDDFEELASDVTPSGRTGFPWIRSAKSVTASPTLCAPTALSPSSS
jgi:O-antigen/teichoic acid export membrane protein